jgi:hypothetical protein
MAQEIINNGTVAGDGTGEILFTAFEKVNDNFTELYDKKFGVWNLAHGGGSQSIPSSTWVAVENDTLGANTITTFALSGVDIYDLMSQRFNYNDLTLADSIEYRVDGEITTTSVNQVAQLRLVLSFGILNIPLNFYYNTFKSVGTYPIFASLRSPLLTESVRINPARMELFSDAGATLNLNGYNIQVTKQNMGT